MITILAWSLVRSQEVFHKSGGYSVATSADQRARYAWLRPIELMWVARTIALLEDTKGRQLPGQRRVRPWRNSEKKPARFGMSPDQFRAYRQTGLYGGYRRAFRNWPTMTIGGDGWTPGHGTRLLAKWMDKQLGPARPGWTMGADDVGVLSSISLKRAHGNEHEWWLKNWRNYDQGNAKSIGYTLPPSSTDYSVLPEAKLLCPLIFGVDDGGCRRREVATALGTMTAAMSHQDICVALSRKFASAPVIALLAHFSRLADAGIDAMDFIARALGAKPTISLTAVAALPGAKAVAGELLKAAKAWNACHDIDLRHIETANRFADAFAEAKQPADCFRALLLHHEDHGGGLRWFLLRNGQVQARTPPHGNGDSSRYRFRLWSLGRLAMQCGLITKLPAALRVEEYLEEEQQEEALDGQ